MYNKLKKQIDFKNIMFLLIIIYLFFLFRRGGDSKFKVATVLILVSLVYAHSEKYKTVKKYIYIYIFGILYLLSLGVVFYLSVDKGNGRIMEFLGMTLYSVVFFLCIINIKLKEKEYNKLLPIISIFSLETIIRGLNELYLNRAIINAPWYRLSGKTYTTIYAAELGICIIIGVMGFYIYTNKRVKVFYSIYILLLLGLLYYTKSRNSMLMIPATLCIIAFLKSKKNKIIVILGSLFIIGLMVRNADKVPGLSRLSTVSSIEIVKKDIRLDIFKEGIKIGSNNLLNGKGFYNYKETTLFLKNKGNFQHFHNIFVETFATQGLITLAFYMIFLGLVFFYALKNYLLEKDSFSKNIKLLAIGVFLFLLFYGLFESIFYFTKIYMIMFTIISINFIQTKNEY
ncbi:MAG: O-antigen ligase family protein [Fusobacteriaceae bacterium]